MHGTKCTKNECVTTTWPKLSNSDLKSFVGNQKKKKRRRRRSTHEEIFQEIKMMSQQACFRSNTVIIVVIINFWLIEWKYISKKNSEVKVENILNTK